MLKKLKAADKSPISKNEQIDQISENDDRQFRLARMKKWRLIIRNLPFTCTNDDIQSAFSQFGIIEEVVIPPSKKNPSQNAGFVFVQFRKQSSAQEAIENLNEQEINGRPVAVDWAVPKDQYMTAVLEEKERDRSGKDSSSPVRPKKSAMVKQLHEDSASTSDSSENEEDSGISNSPPPPIKKKRKMQETESLKPRSNSETDGGVEEGRTVFVRTIPFAIEEDELKEVFSEFGQLNYCVICKYPGTDHSKGSGFVQFAKKEDAEKCLEKGNDQDAGGISIRGQMLSVCVAVSKDNARQLEKEKHERQPKDKRNLHLLRVGLIRSGTADAVGASQSDMAKRMRIESANREKIKNPNIFVSSTRLCVHNLPSQVDEKQLKGICLKAVDDQTAWLKECRIMRDLDRPNSLGVYKSRGYAFVEFTEHEHALNCLKALNNNPAIFASEKRPIVEFSLENRKALLTKQQRAEKAKMKVSESESQYSAANSGIGESSAKQSLLIRRRGKSGKKFVPPSVPPVSGKVVSGKNRKAFPSHFGPKIRHRKRAPRKETAGASEKKSRKEVSRTTRSNIMVNQSRKRSTSSGKVNGSGIKRKKKHVSTDVGESRKRARWFDS